MVKEGFTPVPQLDYAWFTTTLGAIVSGHKQSGVNDLLPWN